MPQFVLTSCSTADMPRSFFESRNIPFVCFHFTMDGVEYPDDLGQTISFEEFYQRVAAGATPTTSQVNAEQFSAFWEPILQQGNDILHLVFSSGLSGTYNAARLACEELSAKYPERRLVVIDSLAASSGFGLLVDAAADLRDEGKSLDEVAEWVEENKLNVHHWFFATDLTSFKRGGRISSSAALVGTLLGICPLLNVDNLGRLIPRKKLRGKNKAIAEMVHMMEEHAQDGLDYSGKCFMCNSACREDAEAVAKLVEEKFPNLNGKVLINSIGTVIGSHTGPGTVALFFFGDKREN